MILSVMHPLQTRNGTAPLISCENSAKVDQVQYYPTIGLKEPVMHVSQFLSSHMTCYSCLVYYTIDQHVGTCFRKWKM
jgi:hypothetical protein